MQFSKDFSILHDADEEFTSNGNKNPAWGMNSTIAKLLESTGVEDRINLVACKTCFEVSMFGEEAKDEKPYNALTRIRSDDVAMNNVKKLFDYLLDTSKEAPDKCIKWKNINDLK